LTEKDTGKRNISSTFNGKLWNCNVHFTYSQFSLSCCTWCILTQKFRKCMVHANIRWIITNLCRM